MQAFPVLYEREHKGCKIPEKGYGGHSAPQRDAAVTFTATDADGKFVSTWLPETTYLLTVPAHDAASNVWVHTSDGAHIAHAAQVKDNVSLTAFGPSAVTAAAASATHDLQHSTAQHSACQLCKQLHTCAIDGHQCEHCVGTSSHVTAMQMALHAHSRARTARAAADKRPHTNARTDARTNARKNAWGSAADELMCSRLQAESALTDSQLN